MVGRMNFVSLPPLSTASIRTPYPSLPPLSTAAIRTPYLSPFHSLHSFRRPTKLRFALPFASPLRSRATLGGRGTHLRLIVPLEVACVRLHRVRLALTEVRRLQRPPPQCPLVPLVLGVDVLQGRETVKSSVVCTVSGLSGTVKTFVSHFDVQRNSSSATYRTYRTYRGRILGTLNILKT